MSLSSSISFKNIYLSLNSLRIIGVSGFKLCWKKFLLFCCILWKFLHKLLMNLIFYIAILYTSNSLMLSLHPIIYSLAVGNFLRNIDSIVWCLIILCQRQANFRISEAPGEICMILRAHRYTARLNLYGK